MWPERTHVAAVREDDSEEIVNTIEENLKEDTKDNVSEEEDLNKNSDEEMCKISYILLLKDIYA